eukprot:14043736-Ditylum_brightwellii.AAC.1
MGERQCTGPHSNPGRHKECKPGSEKPTGGDTAESKEEGTGNKEEKPKNCRSKENEVEDLDEIKETAAVHHKATGT